MSIARFPILAAPYVTPLLAARSSETKTARISLDLGLTHVDVRLSDRGAVLPDGQTLIWQDVERAARDEASHVEGHCFVLRDGGLERVQVFSPAFNRLYSLVATKTAPTLLI